VKINDMRKIFSKKVAGKLGLMVLSLVVFSITAVVMFLSCNKEGGYDPTKIPHRVFFKNKTEAFQLVQSILDQNRPGEKLEVIENITYMDSKDKSYAFVFYKSNKGRSNLSIEKVFEGENEMSATSYQCQGSSCDCTVVAMASNGHIKMSCNCTTCDLVSHNLTVAE
jgi:hypothetical protein